MAKQATNRGGVDTMAVRGWMQVPEVVLPVKLFRVNSLGDFFRKVQGGNTIVFGDGFVLLDDLRNLARSVVGHVSWIDKVHYDDIHVRIGCTRMSDNAFHAASHLSLRSHVVKVVYRRFFEQEINRSARQHIPLQPKSARC